MRLQSTSFGHGEEIPQRHGKKIRNVSPQLAWDGAPAETRSLALSLVDNDPVARRYLHWLVSDLNPAVTSFEEGAAARGLPGGARELTDYAGPFPPSGTHEYDFTLYALDIETTGLSVGCTLDQFSRAIAGHVLATASLVGTFTKKR
ncbi:YbhB/YbcL family Raf kinase inhibitor-like protein [Lacisediminihabitans profunda]|uniref:YbhB/YbcL family Raf kinase inhibitor-like protein n=1 Tax=Lacisediminihabitans profunda TaxID=2594790 RepID=A0A5C8UNF5_9MICO|nr:YbhB/YbcL family Raf kinase inhibitor-like protein [Lacisediminihabitans profunda]TXN29906.1 YbhB/YbcL family Raf kinase inhibitor-like protein [Lacisediminihabitans profunda]